jgi:hypothetical protein
MAFAYIPTFESRCDRNNFLVEKPLIIYSSQKSDRSPTACAVEGAIALGAALAKGTLR